MVNLWNVVSYLIIYVEFIAIKLNYALKLKMGNKYTSG